MLRVKMTENIATRIPKEHKTALQRIARARLLKYSDILREAVMEYLERRRGQKEAA